MRSCLDDIVLKFSINKVVSCSDKIPQELFEFTK